MRLSRDGKLIWFLGPWLSSMMSCGVRGDRGESRVDVDVLLGACCCWDIDLAGGRNGERAGNSGGEVVTIGEVKGLATRRERGPEFVIGLLAKFSPLELAAIAAIAVYSIYETKLAEYALEYGTRSLASCDRQGGTYLEHREQRRAQSQTMVDGREQYFRLSLPKIASVVAGRWPITRCTTVHVFPPILLPSGPPEISPLPTPQYVFVPSLILVSPVESLPQVQASSDVLITDLYLQNS